MSDFYNTKKQDITVSGFLTPDIIASHKKIKT